MKSFFYPCLLLAIGLGWSIASPADTTMTIRSRGEPDTIIYVRGGVVRMDMTNEAGQPEGFMLFDSSRSSLTMVDEKERRKMNLSAEEMEKSMDSMQAYQEQMMTMMEQQMKNLPEHQRRMIEDQMKMRSMSPPMGGQNAARPADKVKLRIAKEGTGKVLQYECRLYTAYRGSEKLSQACMSTAQQLGIPESDYKTIKAMFSHMQEMQDKARSMAGPYGSMDDDSEFLSADIEGLPVSVKSFRTGLKSSLKEVSTRELPDKLFIEPDYPVITMPAPQDFSPPAR